MTYARVFFWRRCVQVSIYLKSVYRQTVLVYIQIWSAHHCRASVRLSLCRHSLWFPSSIPRTCVQSLHWWSTPTPDAPTVEVPSSSIVREAGSRVVSAAHKRTWRKKLKQWSAWLNAPSPDERLGSGWSWWRESVPSFIERASAYTMISPIQSMEVLERLQHTMATRRESKQWSWWYMDTENGRPFGPRNMNPVSGKMLAQSSSAVKPKRWVSSIDIAAGSMS